MHSFHSSIRHFTSQSERMAEELQMLSLLLSGHSLAADPPTWWCQRHRVQNPDATASAVAKDWYANIPVWQTQSNLKLTTILPKTKKRWQDDKEETDTSLHQELDWWFKGCSATPSNVWVDCLTIYCCSFIPSSWWIYILVLSFWRMFGL